MQRLVLVVVTAVLLALSTASPALGQDEGTTAPDLGSTTEVLDPDAVIDPDEAKVPGTTAEEAAETSDELALPETDVEGKTSETRIQSRGYGSAADQPEGLKREEIERVERDCQQASPPPISTMLGVPGIVGGDDGGSWGRYCSPGQRRPFS